jgi:hypothetical protein
MTKAESMEAMAAWPIWLSLVPSFRACAVVQARANADYTPRGDGNNEGQAANAKGLNEPAVRRRLR